MAKSGSAHLLSGVWLCDPSVAHQASLPMEFSQQEYCSGLPFPPPVDSPNPGTEPKSLTAGALAGRFFTTEPPRKPKPGRLLPNPET